LAQVKPEAALHRSVVELLALYAGRGLLAYAHVPNGGYRTPAEAGQFRSFGVRAGVPDLLLWLPGGKSFGIELKATSRNLSPAQVQWHSTLASLGHRIHVCRSIDEVEAALREEGVPGIGVIAEIRSVSAVKPLAAVTEPPEDKTHQAPLQRLSGAIE
jgi:hypothetical protein